MFWGLMDQELLIEAALGLRKQKQTGDMGKGKYRVAQQSTICNKRENVRQVHNV